MQMIIYLLSVLIFRCLFSSTCSTLVSIWLETIFFPGRSFSSLSFMHLLSHSIDYNTFIVLSFHRIIFVASFGFEIWPKYGCLDVYEPCSKMSIVEMVRLGECFEQNVDYFVETFRNRHLFNHFICILDSEYKLNSYRKRFPQISIAT